MFDFEVASDITIEKMKVMLRNNAAQVTINIYTKAGTYAGYDKDPSAWTLQYTGTGIDWAGGFFTSQELPGFPSISLPPGTYAMYIEAINPSNPSANELYIDSTSTDNPYASTQDIAVLRGKGKAGWDTTYSSTYGFQVSIVYTLDGTRYPTQEPTSSPSFSPSQDCSDGNACTLDLWDQVSGTCSFEPVNCDDQDDCTTDSCDSITGCTNTPIPHCCGDGFCSTEETCSSCPQDCCTFESISIPEHPELT